MKTSLEILQDDLNRLEKDYAGLENKLADLEKQNATSDETLKRLKAAINDALNTDKGIMTEYLRV